MPSGSSSSRDHPRVGGEKSFAATPGTSTTGSPPAQAGKRRQSSHCLRPDRDHPRTGGEKLFRLPLFQSPLGSPPHRRGKEIDRLHKAINNRITPAWAGKRLTRPAMTGTPRDHPRVGGEKELGDRFKTAELGSPPRRRGKGQLSVGHQIRERITPAWAGKR